MMNDFRVIFLLILFINGSLSLTSNNTCAPVPRDRRQHICQCYKQLQLKCTFNADINRIESKDLDSGLKAIFYDNVTLPRLSDPEIYDDINANFELNKKRYSNNTKIFYLYFPNFNILNSPYIRVTLKRFFFIPSFAFADEKNSKNIESIVFEIPEVYDFGVDEYAFYNLKVIDTLLLEGAFNQITFHENAFHNSIINELILGCYCIECESFDGRCKVIFGQKSKYLNNNNNKIVKSKSDPYIKSLKLFGVEFDWNLDNVPGMENIEKIEIANSKFKKNFEYEIKTSNQYNNLREFVFKHNNLKSLSQLGYFRNFPKLKILNLNQNEIEFLDDSSFEMLNMLLELYLERNMVSKIDTGVFGQNLNSLKVLNLNQNRIKSIEDGSFKHLEQLEILDLTYNRLSTLTKDTFLGLENLKELYLSYNPFKNFDIDTFKWTMNLIRIDIISQAETDWFNFENNDICLLSYFKCDTQINIDSDQRCNCFVKYTNLIGNPEKSDVVKWYKPCVSSQNDNLNRYFDETKNYFDEIDNLYRNERDPNILSKPILEPKIECPQDLVRNCYLNKNLEFVNSSCLYKKFVLSQSQSLNFKLHDTDKFTNKEEDYTNFLVTDMENYDYKTKDAFKDAIVKESVNKKNHCGFLSNDNCILIILVFVIVAFFISILSLFIGLFLICNRNKYSYHATNTSYPQDE